VSNVSGEIIVAGLVTGTHIIEDIKVAVGHKVAVRIPGELALRSQDLWRGIQQGKLFQLDGGSGLHVSRAPAPENVRVAELEAQVRQLRNELEQERHRNAGLQQLLIGLQTQIQGVQQVAATGQFGYRPVSPANGAPANGAPAVEVVGGEVPTFLPDRIQPKEAEAQIRTTTETAEKSNVSSAASKLRELKQRTSG